MTRRQMIEYCIDDQIKRGVISKSMRETQIHYRLNGIGFAKPMSHVECVAWYEEVRRREGRS